jgi:hypothetical protein
MRTKFWLKSLEGRDHSEDVGVDGRIILKLKLGVISHFGFIGLPK